MRQSRTIRGFFAPAWLMGIVMADEFETEFRELEVEIAKFVRDKVAEDSHGLIAQRFQETVRSLLPAIVAEEFHRIGQVEFERLRHQIADIGADLANTRDARIDRI